MIYICSDFLGDCLVCYTLSSSEILYWMLMIKAYINHDGSEEVIKSREFYHR